MATCAKLHYAILNSKLYSSFIFLDSVLVTFGLGNLQSHTAVRFSWITFMWFCQST